MGVTDKFRGRILINEADVFGVLERRGRGMMYDTGYPGRFTFRVSGTTTHNEWFELHEERFILRILATAAGDTDTHGEFNNVEDPLFIEGAVARYTDIDFEERALLRIDDEIMEILSVDNGDVLLRRGVSGTTPASHGNNEDCFQAASVASPAEDWHIHVGVPGSAVADATAAVAADINERGSQNFVAMNPEDDEVYGLTAEEPGGDWVASDLEFDVDDDGTVMDSERRAGRLAGKTLVCAREVTVGAVEAACDAVRLCFPYDVESFVVQSYDTNGVFREDLDSQCTVTGNRVEIDTTGSTDLDSGDIVRVIAWLDED